jgi:hypothetical protein
MDSVNWDSVTRDSVTRDSVTMDSVPRDSVTRNLVTVPFKGCTPQEIQIRILVFYQKTSHYLYIGTIFFYDHLHLIDKTMYVGRLDF